MKKKENEMYKRTKQTKKYEKFVPERHQSLSMKINCDDNKWMSKEDEVRAINLDLLLCDSVICRCIIIFITE